MDLSLTAIGIVSPVGHDAVTTCASIRAGLSRSGPIDHFCVLDPKTQEMVPLTGCQIQGLTDGFGSIGRWLQMARGAFKDLAKTGGLPAKEDSVFWHRTGLALVTPVLDDERFFFAMHCHQLMIRDTYIQPLLASIDSQILPENTWVLAEGREGAIRAVAVAEQYLRDRDLDRLLILATDSYLDGMSLTWLDGQDRLKTNLHPTGIVPGEAAAAFLLERRAVASRRRARMIGAVAAVALDEEEENYYSDKPNQGRALARSMTKALSEADEATPFLGDMITDLNGETWRAYEIGAALTQVPKDLMGEIRLVTPAVSVGEIGASSVALGLVYAIRSFEGNYATSDQSLVLCSSPTGRVGTLVIRRERPSHGKEG